VKPLGLGGNRVGRRFEDNSTRTGRDSSRRCHVRGGDEVPEQIADPDRVARLRAVRRDTQDAAVDGLDLLHGFVAFDAEERLAGSHQLAVLLQPADERAFLHGPAETGDDNFDWHGLTPH